MPKRFADHLMNLRMTASVIYDRAIASGLSPLETAHAVQPIADELTRSIAEAVQKDLAGVIQAIKHLEHQAEAHEADAKFLLNKAVDSRHHARQLRDAIVEDLKRRGVEHRHEGDFSAVLVSEAGRAALTLR